MIRSITSVHSHVQIRDSVGTWRYASDSFEGCAIQNMCVRFATVHVHAVVSECDMPSPRFTVASQFPLSSFFRRPLDGISNLGRCRCKLSLGETNQTDCFRQLWGRERDCVGQGGVHHRILTLQIQLSAFRHVSWESCVRSH